ncbi:hypothetical protein D7V86_00900 [bacterium D16-51]|nr:hypothetical protein D7V96_04420 [bacterium D16-59]RKI62791.1 hypothetical protein D7V86_00900 [bacterium D16-51]
METLEKRLDILKEHINAENITVMIMGLGSVGTYLLDYLVGKDDPAVKIIVVGRSAEKMESNCNIIRISALIRRRNRSQVIIEPNVDFNDIGQIAECLKKYQPDFLVNTSRAYPGLKYGSISWSNIRAYGIWSPLAVKYIRNIMEAAGQADISSIVINTSYSDAVIPWMKSAGKNYPDFGSGNLNHLIPRIKYAIAEILGIEDFWNIDVVLATSHFHDVVISKEGHTEGMEQLLQAVYQGREVTCSQEEIFSRCKIPMPVDAKRNMMNASSNYEIITCIIDSIREGKKRRIFSPGVFGEIGGYPVEIESGAEGTDIHIDTSAFDLESMRLANRKSIFLDGIEEIEGGSLVYTDCLLEKVEKSFGVSLPKKVSFEEADQVAGMIIQKIILPVLEKKH